MEPDRAPRRIGDLLLDRGLITYAQLEQALQEQRRTKQFLGEILIRLGFVEPRALLAVLSERYQIPHESLSVERVDWRVAKQFPASALSDGRCFPIRADEHTVVVAIANPLDAWTLSAIEQASGSRKVCPVLVLDAELREVLQVYRRQVYQSIEAQLKHGHPETH